MELSALGATCVCPLLPPPPAARAASTNIATPGLSTSEHRHLLGGAAAQATTVRPMPPGETTAAPAVPRPPPLSPEEYAAHIITRLQARFPETYAKANPELEVNSIWLGKTTGNKITLNEEFFGELTKSNYLLFALTIAHEMRHIMQPWWQRLGHKLPITDEPHWWNKAHVQLDLAAEADAYALLDELYLFLRDRGQFEQPTPADEAR